MTDYPSKPPFSYYGGKQRLAAKICALMPPHTVYVEPFCGSAAVYFKKGLPKITNTSHYREVLNDTNNLIANFFRVMQSPEQSAQLIEKLKWTIYSQDEHRLAKELCKQPIEDSVLSAWAWFCNVNWSFAKVAGSGFGCSVVGENNPASHANRVDLLSAYRDRLKYTYIMSEPALRVIERFDSPQTLFYVDPPYPGTDQGDYGGFTQADFEELIYKLKNCRGAVLLSCYDNDAVPLDWEMHSFAVIASSSGITGANRSMSEAGTRQDKKRVERVWYKPASSPMRDSLVSVSENNIKSILNGLE